MALVLGLSLCACGSSSKSIVGTWTFEQKVLEREDGKTEKSDNGFNLALNAYDYVDSISFYNDGTFSVIGRPEIIGNYRIINDGSVVSFTWDNRSASFQFQKKGNTLVFIDELRNWADYDCAKYYFRKS